MNPARYNLTKNTSKYKRLAGKIFQILDVDQNSVIGKNDRILYQRMSSVEQKDLDTSILKQISALRRMFNKLSILSPPPPPPPMKSDENVREEL